MTLILTRDIGRMGVGRGRVGNTGEETEIKKEEKLLGGLHF